jgi:uncharacterized protein DUF4136
MKRFATACVATLVGLVLTACSTIQVEHSVDPGLDLSGSRTWTWSAPDEGGDVSAERHERISSSITKELGARGFAPALDGAGEFLVAYHVFVETKHNSVTTSDPDAFRNRYGWRSTPRETETHIDQYEVGALVIELVYASSGELAWSGEAWTELHEGAKPEQVRQVDDSVARILDRLAPRR